MKLTSLALCLGGISWLSLATSAVAQQVPAGRAPAVQPPAVQPPANQSASDPGAGTVAADPAQTDAGAATAAAAGQTGAGGDIIVTGSRTTTNGNNSPTPITVQSLGELQTTTPATIAEGLNKLPAFQAGYNTAAVANTTQNRGGNYLNLRGFGLNRNLILLDGRRAVPTNTDGSVDTNTLPELLIQRVDVVTGGVAAVYGSDAVSGVVNFVLDHNFNGVKGVLQRSISTYGDGGGWKAGVAAGSNLLGDRLHIEGSYLHYETDSIFNKLSRPFGQERFCQVGAGTVASPASIARDCRWTGATNGGIITTGPGTGLSFKEPGVLSRFVNGAATRTGGTQVGGEGADQSASSITQGLKLDQAFLRLDADVTSNIKAFIQGSYARSQTQGVYSEINLANITFSTANPFLTPAQRSTLSAGGASTFRLGRQFKEIRGPYADAVNEVYSITAGLNGRLFDRVNFDLFYTHGDANVNIETRNNINQEKLSAALDAVTAPSGQIVCRTTLTNPGRFPNCVPINLFGLNSTDANTFGSVQDDTFLANINRLDDVGLTLSGNLFNLPAGPVVVALSGEYRETELEIRTPFLSTATANCADLVFNCPFPGFSAIYQQGTTSPLLASQNVKEAAFEATIPIFRDFVLAKSLELNGAVRYTDYSVSGSATTWKVGATWRPVEDLTLRFTRSRDIRAPSLNDLFQPATIINLNFNDIHTGVSGVVPRINAGNADLVPEVAQTLTAGAVLRPSWLPGFSLAVDYYRVKIDNAIILLQASVPNNQLCEDSGGTSIFCDLFVRPLPFSDRSPANFPTLSFGGPLNAAVLEIEGLDVEANYNFDLAGISAGLPGNLALRFFLSYQPRFDVQNTSTLPVYNQAGFASSAFEGPGPTEKTKITASVNYTSGAFNINVLERWKSGMGYNFVPTVIWSDPRLKSIAYTDVTVGVDIGRQKNMALFFTVQNLFNAQPRIYTSYNGNLINFRNPVVNGDDVIGRYLTAGARFKF